jgi:hypothetical protein
MSLGAFTPYAANINFASIAALVAGTIKCALVTSAYTPNYAVNGHAVWADVSANEIAAGNGYTAGGATVGSPVATAITGGYKLASSSASWTASGGSIPAWRRAVFYYSGSLGGLTNPLIGSFLGDDTPADVPAMASGISLILICPTGGWFDDKVA